MDFNYTAEQDAFRAEVRNWVRSALPYGWGDIVHEPLNETERAVFKRDWDRKLFEAGWPALPGSGSTAAEAPRWSSRRSSWKRWRGPGRRKD